MLENLTFKPPTRSLLACCTDFRERREFCRANLIPLLLKRVSDSKKKVSSVDAHGEKISLSSGKELKNLVWEITRLIRTSPRKRRPSIREWSEEVREIVRAREEAARKRLDELHIKQLDAKVEYSRDILANESTLDSIVPKLNSLAEKLDKLSFRRDSILDMVDSQSLKRMGVLSRAKEYLSELLNFSNKLEEISNSLRDQKSLRSSRIYEIIQTIRKSQESVKSLEAGEKLNLKIKTSIYKEISRLLDHVLEILLDQLSVFLKEYCDWGRLDKIVQQVQGNSSRSSLNEESFESSRAQKNEVLVYKISIALLLIYECIDLTRSFNEPRGKEDSGVEQERLEKQNSNLSIGMRILEQIFPKITSEIVNKLKPLFFSRNSSLASVDKPEWILETFLAVFKSHSSYLESLWNILNAKYGSLKHEDGTNEHGRGNIPSFVEESRFLLVMNGIISASPKKALSISLIRELRGVLKIYLRRILVKDGTPIRDNRIDCIFERFVEQLLLCYRRWSELEHETSVFILFDILNNISIIELSSVKKSSSDGPTEEESGLIQVEELSKAAVNWAKSAFTMVLGGSDSEYLEIFSKPSSFPPECGVLDWLCILNKIYIANQIIGYLSESLVASYTDKFNIKRTIKDLYSSMCSYCGSSIPNIILKWFSETVVYISREAGSRNGQALIMPIKSSLNNKGVSNALASTHGTQNSNSGDYILVLGYSVETVELLNAFSGKLSLFVDCCSSLEVNYDSLRRSELAIHELQESGTHREYPPETFLRVFSTPIVEKSIVGEFVEHIRSEWNMIGHKVGPFIPIVSILLESVDIVYYSLLNLSQDIENSTRFTDSGNPILNKSSLIKISEKERTECIPKLYFGSLKKLEELKDEMIRDIKLELREVMIKPLIYSEIVIPKLENLLSSNSFSGNARILFDDHLAKKINELKYTYILFDLFLSQTNLTRIAQALSVDHTQ
ncbi:hypothetical protein HWI79_2490 [Cryptosporidium felis]|nr:hypothetical protein HWI79_2490 [Cryptosporidium felis]